MSKRSRGWTVGSLRGEARPRAGVLAPDAPSRAAGLSTPPPAKLGQGCCRSMCFGCPWADAVRRGLLPPPY
ncbi:MAG: hypothetical protein M9894_18990 [Planctomycetes bacterium]|nr:hypothetical protein [Planctomycetota bacterium]